MAKSRIRILPDAVANQIAAGEVVERPASIVKELIENSLDSGAKHIEVLFRNGGKSCIRVLDDGCGMSPDEALLCLERHATSKIRAAKDLNSILSFGFRGEALPSIASVSRFRLSSRTQDHDCGSEVLIDGGKLIYHRDHGMPAGTQIEVSNLFNSVPVRRKFMKTDNTEAAHIVHLVRLYAASHPQVAFTLHENNRTLFKSLISHSLRECVERIWSSKPIRDLVDIETENEGFRLRGLISKPGVRRSTRQEMVTLVNGRPVDSKTLTYALLEAYHTHIPKGRYPIVFLFLEMDPSLVDVNVHPAKREVRFRQEGLIRQFVIQSILSKLKECSNTRIHEIKPTETPKTLPTPHISPPSRPRETVQPKITAPREPLATPIASPKPTPTVPATTVQEAPQQAITMPTPKKEDLTWCFLAFFGKHYALFEAEKNLVILNCKGAHQRVWYESIQKGFEDQRIQSQQLLFPIPVELDALMSNALEGHLPTLNKTGFKVELFGRNFYRIEAVPEWLDPAQAEKFLRDAAGLIKEHGGATQKADLLQEKIARFASLQAPQSKNNRTPEAATALANKLLSCNNPLTCPRGYPTYSETTLQDLERRFGLF